FNAPVSEVFAQLSDHEKMGEVLGAKVKRVKDGKGNVNGVGSVRRITPVPLADFEETVTAFEPNKLIEYTVTKGSPIKNHLGRMVFSESNGKTHLHYTIQFDMKLPIPLSGLLMKTILEKLILSGLQKFGKRYG
ncbi:MAG TPA: SRPBCC family protein, partial [Candidatus Kapabacteria bacterium]|nr:SRPBCC family protein [Candidatus Kapabacteria bacterium]